jgi:hypothetical protein
MSLCGLVFTMNAHAYLFCQRTQSGILFLTGRCFAHELLCPSQFFCRNQELSDKDARIQELQLQMEGKRKESKLMQEQLTTRWTSMTLFVLLMHDSWPS